uniref:Uncharacterized protein n=1 Tax=Malurus cyaneus samueli TaxID=2593467 RepID=A0A8C5TLX7_9PASS
MQKMAELLGLRDESGEGTSGAPALSDSCLADNRLNLDVYPDGCCRFLQLFKEQRGEVVQVEFLRLSSNDCLLDTTLGSLPHLKQLKSLVLKGCWLSRVQDRPGDTVQHFIKSRTEGVRVILRSVITVRAINIRSFFDCLIYLLWEDLNAVYIISVSD